MLEKGETTGHPFMRANFATRRARFRQRLDGNSLYSFPDFWDRIPPENLKEEGRNERSSARPGILDLPDDAICQIFGALSEVSTARGALSQENAPLSQTCKRFNEIYRFIFVTSIRCGAGGIRPRDASRVLQRFPRIISLVACKSSQGRTDLCDIFPMRRKNEKPRAVLKSLMFFNISVSVDQVRAVVNSCPQLEKISLVSCRNICDKGLGVLFASVASRCVHVSLKNSFSSSEDLTDDGVANIGVLSSVTTMDLSGIPDHSKTFRASAALVDILDLTISQSPVGSVSLKTALNGMKKLTALNISHTPNLTTEVLTSLPESLTSLNATMCAAISDETPADAFIRLQRLQKLTILLLKHGPLTNLSPFGRLAPYLVSLDMRQSSLGDGWDANLLGVMPRLRDLKLDGCEIREWPLHIAKSLSSIETLTFSGARGMESEMVSLSHMKSLRHLKLCGCHNVGNLTALAVSSLPNLETLSMTSTMIDENGAKAIHAGMSRHTLRTFKVHQKPKRSLRISRVLTHPWQYIADFHAGSSLPGVERQTL